MMYEKSKSVFSQISKVLYENRYCNQEGFSILVCGGKDKNGKVTNEVLELEIPSFKVKKFPSMVKPHLQFSAATINSNVVAVGTRQELKEFLDESFLFLEVYSKKTKTWIHQHIKIDERMFYCIPSFMSKFYFIGGWINSSRKSISSCYTYDINSNTRNKIADLNVARDCAACTVFEGKVVVTGGANYVQGKLKSVEAYDYYEDKWTYLPDMIEARSYHSAVSMGIKMFVIGGFYTSNCEKFDSYSRKFTKINSEIKGSNFDKYFNALSIGNNIIVFKVASTETVVYLYDVVKEQWLKVQCEFTKTMFYTSICKVLYLIGSGQQITFFSFFWS